MTRASCLCGDVVWEAHGPFAFMHHCHCARCRKAHGTPFATFVLVPEDAFRLVAGADRIVRYESSPGTSRPFCGRCGGVVAAGDPIQGMVGMPAGSFDDDPHAQPIAHIFVGSKAPWYEITDELPRFGAYPPGVDAAVFPDLDRPRTTDDGIAGSCLCRAVRYVLTGEPLLSRYCHCSRCRKARAAAHVANVVFPYAGVRYAAGEDHLRTYKIPEAKFFTQTFCDVCGSPMPVHDAGRGIAIVPLGGLDGDPPTRPMEHIFVASKAPWFTITDALPQHPAQSPRTWAAQAAVTLRRS